MHTHRSIARPSFVALAASFVLGAAATANGAVISYIAALDGPSEAPANASPGIGSAQVDYDNVAHTMHLHVTFTGLVSPNTASHIHGLTAVAFTGTAGVATQTPTFVGFPGGTTSGTYDHTFDMTLASTYNSAFISNNGGTTAGAEAAIVAGFAAGKTYLNIHTTAFPGGEIRGFLHPAPPPCPSDLSGDHAVDGADLGALLANWGHAGIGDLNGDGNVDGADLGILLAAWGPCPV